MPFDITVMKSKYEMVHKITEKIEIAFSRVQEV